MSSKIVKIYPALSGKPRSILLEKLHSKVIKYTRNCPLVSITANKEIAKNTKIEHKQKQLHQTDLSFTQAELGVRICFLPHGIIHLQVQHLLL